ncbi:UNVERIFIED_CONTAM: hypothetical protein FKN15_057764 [Acipenser sinensis]
MPGRERTSKPRGHKYLILFTWPDASCSPTLLPVVEILVMDRFLRVMPPSPRKGVGQCDPSTLDDFVAVVEQQLAAEDLATQPVPTSPTRGWQPPQARQCPNKNLGKDELRGGVVEEQPVAVKGLGLPGGNQDINTVPSSD